MSGKSEENAKASPESEDPSERPSIRLSEIERRARDQKLWETLPSKDDPYDPLRLSEREVAALEQALCDGFGTRLSLSTPTEGLRLPAEVNTGLLHHKYYVGRNSEYDPEPDDDGDIWDQEFWTGRSTSDGPAPSEWFPLGFHPIRLRIFFRSQFERFCQYLVAEELAGCDPIEDEWLFADFGWERLYEKPWYELHALQFLDWLQDPDPDILKHPGLVLMVQTDIAGSLGRLVEQYHWRFRYESPAVTGLGARDGASAGGKRRASMRKKEQAKWQAAAEVVWARRPGLTAQAVGEAVRRQLGLDLTARHIARYIRRPSDK